MLHFVTVSHASALLTVYVSLSSSLCLTLYLSPPVLLFYISSSHQHSSSISHILHPSPPSPFIPPSPFPLSSPPFPLLSPILLHSSPPPLLPPPLHFPHAPLTSSFSQRHLMWTEMEWFRTGSSTEDWILMTSLATTMYLTISTGNTVRVCNHRLGWEIWRGRNGVICPGIV